jgi:hypothetical protein
VRDAHTKTFKRVQAYINKSHRILKTDLSENVKVDRRLGLQTNGIHQAEPLVCVLEYLGLSMDKDQVVNASIDGKLRRALIPGHLLNANHWFNKEDEDRRKNITGAPSSSSLPPPLMPLYSLRTRTPARNVEYGKWDQRGKRDNDGKYFLAEAVQSLHDALGGVCCGDWEDNDSFSMNYWKHPKSKKPGMGFFGATIWHKSNSVHAIRFYPDGHVKIKNFNHVFDEKFLTPTTESDHFNVAAFSKAIALHRRRNDKLPFPYEDETLNEAFWREWG